MNPEERRQKLAQYAKAGDQLTGALGSYPEDMWGYKPGPERWSIREILVHIADSEANSYVRCRRAIAEPGAVVMAYDENQWARELGYGDQDPKAALELFKLLRRMTYNLVQGLPDAVWSNTIDHPENGIMTLDDWLAVYSNHVPEHIYQIQATHDAWLAEKKGQPRNPAESLFQHMQ
jgi:hypothetical protein